MDHIQIRFSQWMIPFFALLFLFVQIAVTLLAPAFMDQKKYHFVILTLVGLVSGCAGWACGIILSPIGSQASGAQKVLAGVTVFWSGVVIGHLKELSGLFDAWQKSSITSATKIRLLFGLGVFLFALCVTFNTRFSGTGGVHGGVEVWRGGLGGAYLFPTLSSVGASLAGSPAIRRGKAERNWARRSHACIL